MKSKNRTLVFLVLSLSALIFSSCSKKPPKDEYISDVLNKEINVFGAYLNDSKDFAELDGEKVEAEPCVVANGYEYNHEALGVNIGYHGEYLTIRRITTWNENTSVLGIVPGMKIEDARKIAEDKGFSPYENSDFKFIANNNVILTLLSKDKSLSDGVTIEIKAD